MAMLNVACVWGMNRLTSLMRDHSRRLGEKKREVWCPPTRQSGTWLCQHGPGGGGACPCSTVVTFGPDTEAGWR